ncbi:MAG: zinc-binding dehydrogenase, partial [Pseudomonadota bacterium]
GQRVLVRSVQADEPNEQGVSCVTLGSEYDGGFAEYCKVPDKQALKIISDWTDIELASVPCAFSTAEGMLQRASVGAETVLISGASGGVGSAAVQLAKRRGATVIALASASKAASVKDIGADRVLDRDADLLDELGECSVDVVADLVVGDQWPDFLKVLKRGGRYVTSGAIAGPLVELDLRTLYLKDLTFYGSTYQPDKVFEDLVTYIERNEVKPLVSASFELKDIALAQEAFLAKQYAGKLVLVP